MTHEKEHHPSQSILSVDFLAACSSGHSSYCDGEIGELRQGLADKNPDKSLTIIASASNLDVNAICPAHKISALNVKTLYELLRITAFVVKL